MPRVALVGRGEKGVAWHHEAARCAKQARSPAGAKTTGRLSGGSCVTKASPNTTEGGPAQATNILVYKVFADGFIGLNLGSSAAQSVVLMAIVIALTFIQFRYIERRVHY